MQYRVMVPEFWFEARTHREGDVIEATNTTEINTNVALGRLAPLPTTGAMVERRLPAKNNAALRAPDDAPAPVPIRQPERRRYMRRDLTVKE